MGARISVRVYRTIGGKESMRLRYPILCALTLVVGAVAVGQSPGVRIAPAKLNRTLNCDEQGHAFCVDRYTRKNYEGEYVGHDEPAVLFYSNTPGSGSQTTYTLILPQDPSTQPKQDATGGTFNFQLHPAFWFGMAICDSQSAPNPDPNGVCVPASDTNIANNSNRLAPDYIGKHPGTAFLELQFYPPGWIDTPELSVDTQYYAALNIDSLSINYNTGQVNNRSCQSQLGDEPVNFAVITKDGVPLHPANPLGVAFPGATFRNDLSNVLIMNPGDTLKITIQDNPGGVQVLITDLTNGQSGSMIGGPAAGFAQVNWAPGAARCSVKPYAFRPMYSTSSESTRVPWAVHSYNIAFSDEIGHFEFCNAFNMDQNDPNFLNCTSPGVGDAKLGPDDAPCANASFFGLPSSFIDVIGCVGDDLDFNGTGYGRNWPGSGFGIDIFSDPLLRPTPIQFSSPVFTNPAGNPENYSRVAFESDVPSFEPPCDIVSGFGCTSTPQGAQFYPIYSTTNTLIPGANGALARQCLWQLGGGNIPGTANNFGGTAEAEYGDLLSLPYPGGSGAEFLKLNFHQTVGFNPCQVLPAH